VHASFPEEEHGEACENEGPFCSGGFIGKSSWFVSFALLLFFFGGFSLLRSNRYLLFSFSI
jgi:hypothetical protein